MVEITDSLACLYTGRVESRGDDYVVTVPASEVEHGGVAVGERYRVALLDRAVSGEPEAADEAADDRSVSRDDAVRSDPPVSEGEVRNVTVETLGDKGDGIAKIERGYVVIVPDAEPGDEPTVEITSVRENVSFAEVVEE